MRGKNIPDGKNNMVKTLGWEKERLSQVTERWTVQLERYVKALKCF